MAIETLAGLSVAAGHALLPVPPRARRMARAFDAAGQGRRAKGWFADKQAINSLLFQNLELLRDRSRDAVRKDPHASNALDSYVANAIGTGITPLCEHPDVKRRDYLHRKFAFWARYSDFDGLTDLYGQQALATRSMMEAGEVLAIMDSRPPRAMRGMVPLKVRILEGDHLPINGWPLATANVPEGHEVRYGIEFDADDQRVAYHLHRDHPGETNGMIRRNFELVRVPADQVIHMFRPLRPGQMRGLPWLTCVLVALYELGLYRDADLVRKKVGALFAGFIRTNASDDAITPEDDKDGLTAEASFEPGTLQKLLPGEEIEFPNVPDSGDYEQYVSSVLRSIAVGVGLTEHMLTGDLRGANYSSLRAGLLEFRRKCEQLQYSVIVHQFCRRIWWEWLTVGYISGTLKLPGFAEEPEQYDARWVTPGWPWVDPLKDIEAKVVAIRAGLDSRRSTAAEQGEDIDQIDADNAADQKRAKQLELTYDSYATDDPEAGEKTTEKRERRKEKILDDDRARERAASLVQ